MNLCKCEQSIPNGEGGCVKCGRWLKPIRIQRRDLTEGEKRRRARISAHWKGKPRASTKRSSANRAGAR